MELNNLRKLLQKYEEGNTSLEEERDLQIYFSTKEIPEEFLVYRNIFKFKEKAKEVEYSKEIQLDTSRKRKWAYVGIAASILLIMSFLFFSEVSNKKMETQNLGTIEDPEEAYLKTKETLQMVANVFNEGRDDLEYLNEFNKTKNKIITIK